MNVKNIKKTIHSIQESEYFDQGKFHQCGTPGCIAGHAVSLRPDFVRFSGTFKVVLKEKTDRVQFVGEPITVFEDKTVGIVEAAADFLELGPSDPWGYWEIFCIQFLSDCGSKNEAIFKLKQMIKEREDR